MTTFARMFALLAAGAGLVLALAGTPGAGLAGMTGQPKPGPAEGVLELLKFDRLGKLLSQDEDQLDRIAKRFAGDPPSHVFVLSHGWNNTQESAKESYDLVLAEMKKLADQFGLRPKGYKPAVIGLHWPSMAFEDDEQLI